MSENAKADESGGASKVVLAVLGSVLLGLVVSVMAQWDGGQPPEQETPQADNTGETPQEKFVQGNFSELVDAMAEDACWVGDAAIQWKSYLKRPHATVETIRGYFQQAAEEFGVPQELLEAIGKLESNWTQMGPSIDQGWGIMHLVENHYCDTLGEAAELLGVDRQVLKDDARQNIRGAAALLAQYAGPSRKKFKQLEDWFDAAKRFSGLRDDELEEMQAQRYFELLRDGQSSPNLWGESVDVASRPEVNVEDRLMQRMTPQRMPQPPTPDYPGVELNLTSCNYARGRTQTINRWVNHWIGVGTAAGAVAWFKNCSSAVSAHFVVDQRGRITQVVRVADTAYHAAGHNARSIGVEHEVTVNNPAAWNSEPMLQASAMIARYFINRLNISLVSGHKDLPGASTQCPGPLPWGRWGQLVGGNPTECFDAGIGVVYQEELKRLNEACNTDDLYDVQPCHDEFIYCEDLPDFSTTVRKRVPDVRALLNRGFTVTASLGAVARKGGNQRLGLRWSGNGIVDGSTWGACESGNHPGCLLGWNGPIISDNVVRSGESGFFASGGEVEVSLIGGDRGYGCGTILAADISICLTPPAQTGPAVDYIAPSTPGGLVVESAMCGQVNLRWTTNSVVDYGGSGLAGYGIYRGRVQGGQVDYVGIAVADAGSDSFLVSGGSEGPGVNNCYMVSAFDGAGNYSDLTGPACVVIPPLPPPYDLVATVVTEDTIRLSWKNNESQVLGSWVERAPRANGPWSQIATVWANQAGNTYLDQGLQSEKTYYYRVRSFTAACVSEYAVVGAGGAPARLAQHSGSTVLQVTTKARRDNPADQQPPSNYTPPSSDEVFGRYTHANLDRYTFANIGTPSFEVPVNITRVFSMNKRDYDKLIHKAELVVRAWDVDPEQTTACGGCGERNMVYLNGRELGPLKSGGSGQFSETVFPLEPAWFEDGTAMAIKDATYAWGRDGLALNPEPVLPQPGQNAVKIIPNTQLCADANGVCWGVSVDYVEIRIKAMRPALLVHGMASNAESTWGEFHTYIPGNLSIAFDGEPCIPGINICNFRTPEEQAARFRNVYVPAMLQLFGVRKFNVIAHSKGGIDSSLAIMNRPELTENLICIASPLQGSEHGEHLNYEHYFQVATAAALAEITYNAYQIFSAVAALRQLHALGTTGTIIGGGPISAVVLTANIAWELRNFLNSSQYSDLSWRAKIYLVDALSQNLSVGARANYYYRFRQPNGTYRDPLPNVRQYYYSAEAYTGGPGHFNDRYFEPQLDSAKCIAQKALDILRAVLTVTRVFPGYTVPRHLAYPFSQTVYTPAPVYNDGYVSETRCFPPWRSGPDDRGNYSHTHSGGVQPDYLNPVRGVLNAPPVGTWAVGLMQQSVSPPAQSRMGQRSTKHGEGGISPTMLANRFNMDTVYSSGELYAWGVPFALFVTNEVRTYSFPIDSTVSNLFLYVAMVLPHDGINATLIGPDGQAAAVTNNLGMFQAELIAPVPGQWQLQVASGGTNLMSAAVYVDSPIELIGNVGNVQSLRVGQAIPLGANFRNGSTGLAGATVQVRAMYLGAPLSDWVTLADQGDGSYQGQITADAELVVGRVDFEFVATGTVDGEDVQRIAYVVDLFVRPDFASLMYGIAVPDGMNSSGFYERIDVPVTVTVQEDANLEIWGELRGCGGSASSSAMTNGMFEAGTHEVVLSFDGSVLCQSGCQGPFVLDLSVVYPDLNGVTDIVAQGQSIEIPACGQMAGSPSDLVLTKTAAQDPARLDAPLTYLLEVVNQGGSDAAGVVLTDQLPSSVQFVSAHTSQGDCAQAGGVVSCSLGDLRVGESVSIAITVQPTQTGVVTNSAAVGTSSLETDTSNNQAVSVTTVANAADLQAVTSEQPVDTNANGFHDRLDIGLRLMLHVPGTYTVWGQLADAAGDEVVTAQQSFAGDGIQDLILSFDGPTIGRSERVGPYSLSVVVLDEFGFVAEDFGEAYNTAAYSFYQFEGSPPQLRVSQVVEGGEDLFQLVRYTVTVTNAGATAASDVILQNEVTPTVSITSVISSQGSCLTGSGITCYIGSVTAGGSATVVIEGLILTAGEVGNTATVGGSTPPADPSDTVSAVMDRVGLPRLVATKTSDPYPLVIDAPLDYTLQVRNTGEGAARDLVLVDTLPPEVDLIGFVSTQGSCVQSNQSVVCNLGKLEPEATVTTVINVIPRARGALTNSAGVLVNRAMVTTSSWTIDTDGASVVDYTGQQLPDLRMAASGPATAVVGERISYTVNVTNDSFVAVKDVTLQATLPARVWDVQGFVFGPGSAQGGGCALDEDGRGVTCRINQLEGYELITGGSTNTAPASVIFDISYIPTRTGLQTNTFAVSIPRAERTLTNNSAFAVTTVTNGVAPDLLSFVYFNTWPAGEVEADTAMYHEIVFLNVSPETTIRSVWFTNILPQEVRLDGVDWGSGVISFCTVSNNVIACYADSLQPDEGGSVFIEFTPIVPDVVLTNIAMVDGIPWDPTTNNNTVVSLTTVKAPPPPADLSMSLLYAEVYSCQEAVYGLRITNSGGLAQEVRLEGQGSGLIGVDGAVSCSNSGGIFICDLGDIPGGQFIDVYPYLGWRVSGLYTFTVTAPGGDPDPSDNTVSHVADTDVDAAVTVVGPTAAVGIGEEVVYRARVEVLRAPDTAYVYPSLYGAFAPELTILSVEGGPDWGCYYEGGFIACEEMEFYIEPGYLYPPSGYYDIEIRVVANSAGAFANDLGLYTSCDVNSANNFTNLVLIVGDGGGGPVDTDGDGMPDDWELAHGLNPNDPADAALDSDGDGLSNLAEYYAGTDPRVPASTLALSGVQTVGNDIVVRFATVSGKLYRVERATDFRGGIWTVVADNVVGTGGIVSVTDIGAAGLPQRYYRVRLADHLEVMAPQAVGFQQMTLREGRNFIGLPLWPFANTLADALPVTLLPAAGTEASATVVDIWDQQTQILSNRYWLSNIAGFDGWRRSNFTDANNTALDPGKGLILTLRSGQGARTLPLTGFVPTTAQIQAVASHSASNLYTLAASPYPVAVPLSSSKLLESGFVGGTSLVTSDNLLFFNPVTQVFDTKIWYDSVNRVWRNADASIATKQLEPGESFLILRRKRAASMIWTNPVPYTVPLQGP